MRNSSVDNKRLGRHSSSNLLRTYATYETHRDTERSVKTPLFRDRFGSAWYRSAYHSISCARNAVNQTVPHETGGRINSIFFFNATRHGAASVYPADQVVRFLHIPWSQKPSGTVTSTHLYYMLPTGRHRSYEIRVSLLDHCFNTVGENSNNIVRRARNGPGGKRFARFGFTPFCFGRDRDSSSFFLFRFCVG